MLEIGQNISGLSPKELFELRNSIDPDKLGFDDEIEGCSEEFITDEILSKAKISGNGYQIKDNLTDVNFTNSYSTSRIKYIVIHYTANNGDSAWGNTNYFKSTYRGASAHYFVDEGDTIWRCVSDKNISWHCGGGLQGSGGHSYYKICTNSNSIGIEMCSRILNGKYYFKDRTIENCASLVKYLMNRYNVPISNVIRHYDVTGKICPEPFVRDINVWNSFKARIGGASVATLKPGVYKVVNCTSLNIRSTNSTSGFIIGSLKPGDQITINEINNGWGKLDSNGWVSLDYCEFISEKAKEHWAQPFLNRLHADGKIKDEEQWNNFDAPAKTSLVLALIDNVSGGTWKSNEADSKIHWCQPTVISLCGKKIITDYNQWVERLNLNLSKGLLLALVDNMKGGTWAPYNTRYDVDHWARNSLDSLCDKVIVSNPQEWTNFEGEVSIALTLSLIYKAIYGAN